jgi:DNA polymerase-4
MAPQKTEPRFTGERWILHADMDAFYASVEQRDHPELRGKPVIVGAGSARGVVAAASYEARKFGVHSAMPGFRAKQLCPHAIFVPSNIEHYAAVSSDVHAVFERFTPEIEPIALDEAFLDVSASVGLYAGSARELAVALKREVFEATSLCVSVGVAPSKLVAKIACTLSKPNGLRVIPQNEVRALLDPLPVRKLWGVGPVLEQELVRRGFRTLADLANHDPDALVQQLGPRALELRALARGIDTRAVVADRAPKSIGEENTFETDVLDRDVVANALGAHSENVARRLRRAGYRARTISLKAKLGRARGNKPGRTDRDGEPNYPLLTRSRTILNPTDDGLVLRDVVLALWDELALLEPVRLLGVSVSKLDPRETQQLDLFAPPKKDALGPTLDAITERFGKAAIRRGDRAPEKITHSRSRKPGEH